MKMVLHLVEVGLIICGIAAAIYLLSNKKKKQNDMHNDCKEPENEEYSADNAPLAAASATQDEFGFEDDKSSAIENMYFRHMDAANAMKDSIETIHENLEVSETANDVIDNISSELDKMLSEE